MMQLRFYCNLAKLSNNEIGAQSTDFKFKSQIATVLAVFAYLRQFSQLLHIKSQKR